MEPKAYDSFVDLAACHCPICHVGTCTCGDCPKCEPWYVKGWVHAKW